MRNGAGLGPEELAVDTIYNSFGVGQGGESLQRFALHLFVGMFPEQRAIIAEPVAEQARVYLGEESISCRKTLRRARDFANSDLHAKTSDKMNGWKDVNRAYSDLRAALNEPQVSPQTNYRRALWAGTLMADRDQRFVHMSVGREKPNEPDQYGLYTANWNSHLLHHAYIEQQAEMPVGRGRMQHVAAYIASIFCETIAAGNIEALESVHFSQANLSELRGTVGIHLDHYPAHSALIDGSFMKNVMSDDLMPLLQDAGPGRTPRVEAVL